MASGDMDVQKTARKKYVRVSDDDVRLAVELSRRYGLPSHEIAEKFEVSASCVRNWLRGYRRGAIGAQQ